MDKDSKPSWFASLPIGGSGITDKQWAHIVACSGLPPEARSLIERAIAQYKIFDQALQRTAPPGTTRKSLAELATKIEALSVELEGVAENPLAIVGLALAIEDGEGNVARQAEVRNRLKAADTKLRTLSHWLKSASARVAVGRPGAHGAAVKNSLFVKTLNDVLLQFTGKGISRSGKGRPTPRDFVQAVFRVADPGVHETAIEEAMKRVIRGRGEIAGRKAR